MSTHPELPPNAHALVREAVRGTLEGLGFDLHNPSHLQADMLYLRKIRRGSEDMARVVRHSILTLLVSTGLFLLWQAVKRAVME